jgi:broad specificity phosphatase PhoE
MRYLVRHADAGDKRAWTGHDDDRPLSNAGHREAAGLVAQLAGHSIAEIVSSPAVRCLQTVQPLAERRRLAIRTDAALTVDADVDLAVALLLYPRADDVVLCTHGELIGPMLDRLRGLGAPIGDGATWPKGSVWALEAVDGRVTTATFLPPRQTEDPR